MGNDNSGYSQDVLDSVSLDWYEASLQNSCLLPDVGIDESLMKYSGTDSNTMLQAYSNDLVSTVPDYMEKFGSSLGSFTPIPNAVGLGALVISMILDLIIKSSTEQTDNTYTMLQRVFGEEKASAVRDTVSTYVTRHRMFMNNEQRLQEELRRLEEQLSGHLTVLKNSLLHDGQMRSRGLKIWVNGASFHVQMLIHEARLKRMRRQHVLNDVDSIKAVIALYLEDLDHLLEKYKTYRKSVTKIFSHQFCGGYVITAYSCSIKECYIENKEVKCDILLNRKDHCENDDELIDAYVTRLISSYEPIRDLKSHFSNITNNLNFLINQHDKFTLTSTA